MPSEDAQPAAAHTAGKYARLGWAIFPIYEPGDAPSGCSCDAGIDESGQPVCSVAKHPRTRNGFKNATTTPETIRRWWERWPNANIGIATGSVSGLIVIDVDPRHGGDESWRDLVRELGLKDLQMPQVITGGGGAHYYFQHPGGFVRSTTAIRPGVDVRGDRGYVVAPPSLHASGARYEWEVGSEPW